jgi:hypothetical protein
VHVGLFYWHSDIVADYAASSLEFREAGIDKGYQKDQLEKDTAFLHSIKRKRQQEDRA